MRPLERARISLAVAIVAANGPSLAFGQDQELEEGLRYLLDNALEIRIGLRLSEDGQQVTWNSQQTEVTIPGRAVDVHLTGDNLRVEAVFTPYVDVRGAITLVAQAQVWLSDASDKAVRYATTYRSVPIGIGEKLLFFPLGVADQLADEVTLRLEVEIAPFVFDSAIIAESASETDQT